jgi:hypothetical protein
MHVVGPRLGVAAERQMATSLQLALSQLFYKGHRLLPALPKTIKIFKLGSISVQNQENKHYLCSLNIVF